MFLDESVFDDADAKKPHYRKELALKSSDGPLSLDDVEDFESFGNAGTNSSSSGSRARMLAQQRELQLKKRQSAMQSGGMVRSSLDGSARSNSPLRDSSDHITPALRQFSAPKSLKDSSADISNETSNEFTKSTLPIGTARLTGRARESKSSDDEDDEIRERVPGSAERLKDRETTLRATSYARRRYSDDEDDDADYNYTSRNKRYDDEVGKSDFKRDYEERRSGSSHNLGNGRKHDDRGSRSGSNRDDDRWDGSGSASSADSRNGRSSREDRGARSGREKSRRDSPPPDTLSGSSASSSSSAPEVPRPIAPPVPLDMSDMKRFLMSPVPKGSGIVQCYIRRNKSGTNKLFPVFSLYLKDGDRFLLASKKRPNNKTSNYLISMRESDLSRDGENYLGKLRSNFVGTEFQIFDNGHNPKDAGDGGGPEVRKELGSIMYAANVLGSRGPRKMQVALPAVDENNRITVWRSGASGGQDDILTRIKERNFRDLAYLINKPPRWNEQVGAYVLNFNGRVTMASVKNFQLVDPDEQNAVVLQFGRVGKDDFTMDLQWPMSPFQAFAITLSSFDSKIACD